VDGDGTIPARRRAEAQLQKSPFETLEQKIKVRRHEFAQSLQAKGKVSVYLDPPTPVRDVVGVDGPSRGPASAAVTIVEYEDFQCPFCKSSQRTLDQVLLRYKD